MFKALEAFRGQLEALHVTVSFGSGGMQSVTVSPKVSPEAAQKSPQLAQPFGFTATAEDLEAGFVQALAEVSVARRTLAEQAATQAKALASAKSTVSKPVSPKTTAPTSDEAADATAGTSPTPANAPTTITNASNLFDDAQE